MVGGASLGARKACQAAAELWCGALGRGVSLLGHRGCRWARAGSGAAVGHLVMPQGWAMASTPAGRVGDRGACRSSARRVRWSRGCLG